MRPSERLPEQSGDALDQLRNALKSAENRQGKRGDRPVEARPGTPPKGEEPRSRTGGNSTNVGFVSPPDTRKGEESPSRTGGNSGVITDPEKARLRAQYLMRQVGIAGDGRITSTRGDAREVLEELIRTCPDTYEAKEAKKLLEHMDKMKAALSEKGPNDGKPLDLAEILARESAQRKEIEAAGRSGNVNVVGELARQHAVERVRWNGATVKGRAEVVSVVGSSATVWMQEDARRMRTIHTTVKGKDDPVFEKLKRGDVVIIQGTLGYSYNPLGGQLSIKDCVFSLNLEGDPPARRPIREPRRPGQ
jgi:hypothetical protein